MTREEILKSNYMKLDGACEDDWQEGSKDEMHQCILTAMSEFAQQEVAAALSTQSPKWVTGSEKDLVDAGDKHWRDKKTKYPISAGAACHSIHSLGQAVEYLDESPSSTHPLQQKITELLEVNQGLREALVYISNFSPTHIAEVAHKALETYK